MHSAQPGFDVSFNPWGDGGKRNSSPGRSRISRKTIAWGMPDVFRCLRCEYSCAYFTTPARTRLRVHWAPGIPRALFHEGRKSSGKTRAPHAARSQIHAFTSSTIESEIGNVHLCGGLVFPPKRSAIALGGEGGRPKAGRVGAILANENARALRKRLTSQ